MSGILLGTHGGSGADGAVRVASLLARRLGVPLTTLVVDEPIPVADYGYGIVYVPTAEDDEGLRQALLGSVRTQLQRCDVGETTPLLRTGLAVSELAAVARTTHADLVVTGLGSHDVMDRAFGGETALRLAQSASTPVLAVPAGATAIPRRVVAATDFSLSSRHAASAAARWLQTGDQLHLAYVAVRGQQEARDVPQVERPAVMAQLVSLGADLRVPPGVHMECIELSGNPARALLDYAKRVDADLITLGSRGYGALKRIVLGSVASKVIRLATTGVLVSPIGCTP